MDQDAATQLADRLIMTPAEDLETGKSEHERRRTWESLQDSPTLDQDPFNCLYMLGAKKTLGFDCAKCPVRPKGIRLTNGADGTPSQAATGLTPLVLERALADQLLAHVLVHGHPPQHVDPAVFPTTPADDIPLPIHGLVYEVVGAGVAQAAAIAEWLDRRPFEALVDAETSRKARQDQDLQNSIRRQLTEAATALVTRLQRPRLPKH